MVSARKVKYIATIKAIAAAARQVQARSFDRAPVWSNAANGSDSQPNPIAVIQRIPLMKAFRAAYLILIVQEC